MSKLEISKFVQIVIGIFVVAILGIVISCIVASQMMKNSAGASSPDSAETIAQQLVELPRPLPPGWRYGVGVDVGGYQKSATLQATPPGHGEVRIQLISQSFGKNTPSAKAVASRFKMPPVAGMTFEVDSRGEETIGGEKAYYVRQHGIFMSKKQALEVALIDTGNGGILQIQTTEDGMDKFDPNLVDPLIKSIKSIRKSEKHTE